MTSPILVLGPGRSGKTTLARMLRLKLPGYNLLHADALRTAIMKQLPAKYPEELLHYEKTPHYANLLLGLVSEQLAQDQNTQGLILDGGVISPKFIANHPIITAHSPIIVFLGHGNLDAEGIFKLIRQNDTLADWSSKLDDDALRAKTTYFAKQNQIYRAECADTGLHYIDTSKDRPAILRNLANTVIKIALH